VEMLLGILDWVVKIAVVISLTRAVWKGTTRSGLLAAVLTVAFLLFGLVSLCAAAGLQAGSSYNQTALLIFLVVIAIVASRTLAIKPAQ
jgi:hypothetical protein